MPDSQTLERPVAANDASSELAQQSYVDLERQMAVALARE